MLVSVIDENQAVFPSVDVNPTSKKFKFSFDTSSNEETNDETMIQMDFMSFLKKPCQNNENHLQELTLHPWVQKLFVKYNSMLPSVAALERSVPLSGIHIRLYISSIFR